MDLLLSPVGLIFIAGIFYLARRGGELTFNMPAHRPLAEQLNSYVLENYHLVKQPGHEFGYELRSGVADQIREYMADRLISRMRAHDLKRTVVKAIEQSGRGYGDGVEFRVSRQSIAYEVSKVFNGVIEDFDQKAQAWSR